MQNLTQTRSYMAQETPFEPALILSVGWRRKWLVLTCLASGLALGAGLSMVLPRVYQSAAQIAVVKKRPDAVTGVDTRPMGAEEYLAPPQEVLKSSMIIDTAIRSKRLAALPIFAEEEDPTEPIRKALIITTGKALPGQAVVYKLAYRGPSPDDCRTVLTAVLEPFTEYL